MADIVDKRLALVVGNSTYLHAPELVNPINDATLISRELKALGFEVITGLDADRNDFCNYLSIFETKAKKTNVALFFFAGHGLQVSGENYLLPIDSTIETPTHLKLQAIRLNDIMSAIEGASATSIFILDACRNNPFAQNIARSLGVRATSVDRGLAKVETTLGSFIAFATRPGAVAQDGTTKNSPFTSALSSHIQEAGVSISDMMINVRNDVINSTNGLQEPWEESSLLKSFYFQPIVPHPTTGNVLPESEKQSKLLATNVSHQSNVSKTVDNEGVHDGEKFSIFGRFKKLLNSVTARAAWYIVTSIFTLVAAFLWLYLGPQIAELICRDSLFGFEGLTKCRSFFGAAI